MIDVPGMGEMAFDPGRDLVFDYGPALPGHANGMILRATDAQGDVIMEETYYSIGGGLRPDGGGTGRCGRRQGTGAGRCALSV